MKGLVREVACTIIVIVNNFKKTQIPLITWIVASKSQDENILVPASVA